MPEHVVSLLRPNSEVRNSTNTMEQCMKEQRSRSSWNVSSCFRGFRIHGFPIHDFRTRCYLIVWFHSLCCEIRFHCCCCCCCCRRQRSLPVRTIQAVPWRPQCTVQRRRSTVSFSYDEHGRHNGTLLVSFYSCYHSLRKYHLISTGLMLSHCQKVFMELLPECFCLIDCCCWRTELWRYWWLTQRQPSSYIPPARWLVKVKQTSALISTTNFPCIITLIIALFGLINVRYSLFENDSSKSLR